MDSGVEGSYKASNLVPSRPHDIYGHHERSWAPAIEEAWLGKGPSTFYKVAISLQMAEERM